MRNRPCSQIHFVVEWGGASPIQATEVSGLDIEYDVFTYRSGVSKDYGDQMSPGRVRYPNIRIKRNIIRGHNEFYEWINTIQLDAVERRNVTIALLDEEHEPFMVWKVRDAFPVRLIGPVLDATGAGPATETLELCHEGLVVETT